MKINIEVNNLDELKELCAQLTGGIVVAETTPDPEPKKKTTSKKKAAKKASTPGGDSTPDTEQSKPGEQQDSIETAEEKEVSATANLHPDVTRKQVTELVKETMKKGRTDVVKTALGRINAAKVTEIPDNLLGVFYTDLEALLGGE
ncbi:hypothetical protein MMI99_00945 [Enterococcus cecorum]|uniref:hypothetical protein n=1 Tax=Enterococcus cecorum TaxID=44008 RepID=UPI001FAB7367|nr:hypothetical protein [Enterococcus cecorum]MCJ0586566.1 hypothetical protein [Enterococcus cecorum]MCJ0591244.1 hypothetical protein [Enterococcus cecorum]